MDNGLTFRPGTPADSHDIFLVFEETFADLWARLGNKTPTSWGDTEKMAQIWAQRQGIYEHLAQTAERFWIAEREGEIIGFSRAILRDGVRQLTEFFVRPDVQASGAGRELLARSFPADGARRRSIIATIDMGAQSLYLRAGVTPRVPLYYFGRRPEATPVATDLDFEPLTAAEEHLAAVGEIDREILGFDRAVDHGWLLSERSGYLYLRDGRPVGYGYVGVASGPFALLAQRDFPAVLSHAETKAAADHRWFGVEVPMTNKAAVDHLLRRKFRIDNFVGVMMQDEPFGRLANYIVTSPPFLL